MPEYLAPGVYVEEVSFRSKSIEGVPTSTTGFAGMTRFGPVYYTGGPSTSEPRLITSFTDFERVYGGLEPLRIEDERPCYLAHAARAFFMNGGKRLYVSRVFSPKSAGGNADPGIASRSIPVAGTTASWRARWPGSFGNVWVDTQVSRSKNIAYVHKDLAIVQVQRAKKGAIVEVITGGGTPPQGNDPLVPANLAEVDIDPTDGRQVFRRGGAAFQPNPGDVIQLIELFVDVRVGDERRDAYGELGATSVHKRDIKKILERDNPEDESAVVWLDWDPRTTTDADAAAKLMVALQQNPNKRLEGGNDGALPQADGARDSFEGMESDLDHPEVKATGLAALGEIDDIAIIAIPDAGDLGDEDVSFVVHQAVISQCENQHYRIGIIDPPPNASMTAVRNYRGRFDTKYAALYHPWIEILDPTERFSQGAPPKRMTLPPSGFVAGIYARSDIERGVHKAPANEVVRGLTKFEININKGRQDVLNPEGINALRFFEGRGNRVWGARTMSSDPEWKYVNVRRLFIYLEHSIDKSTQWAVFEPNNERLWANIRQTVEDFLFILWKDGALLGSKPSDAYFVLCDRTTMSQNDLDNGRLICLIGVAPTKPAEFVIFRIGQFTANAKLT
jgi:hypothetical protein